jgi:uncharacterized membrane protein (DUF441 family)
LDSIGWCNHPTAWYILLKITIAIPLKKGEIYTNDMADEIFMFALTCGVFVVFTAILFGSRVKRKSTEVKIKEKHE